MSSIRSTSCATRKSVTYWAGFDFCSFAILFDYLSIWKVLLAADFRTGPYGRFSVQRIHLNRSYPGVAVVFSRLEPDSSFRILSETDPGRCGEVFVSLSEKQSKRHKIRNAGAEILKILRLRGHSDHDVRPQTAQHQIPRMTSL